MLTYFVVQTFTRGRKGAIVADAPLQAQGPDHAKRLAEKYSRQKAGAVAFSRTGDPTTGDFDDAVIIAAFGLVPDESQQLAIAS